MRRRISWTAGAGRRGRKDQRENGEGREDREIQGLIASLAGDTYHTPELVSTCTGQPVTPGATFADAYVGIMAIAKQAGVPLIINYGVSPFDPLTFAAVLG